MTNILGISLDDRWVNLAQLSEDRPLAVGRHTVPVSDSLASSGASRSSSAVPRTRAQLVANNVASAVADYRPRVDAVVTDIGSLIAHSLRQSAYTPASRVTSVRLSPSSTSIQAPLGGWPAPVRGYVDGGHVHLVGGTDLNTGESVQIDHGQLDAALRMADARDSQAFAVTAVGSLLNPAPEHQVADYLIRHGSGRPVVLSHEIGGLRFFEREASTILNAGLLQPTADLVDTLYPSMLRALPTARHAFFLADGSRVGREEARTFPVRALCSRWAGLAQGAAASLGLSSAVIMCWSAQRSHMMVLEDGMLRVNRVRSLPSVLPGVHLSQRHAAWIELTTAIRESITRELIQVLEIPVIALASGSDPPGEDLEEAAGFERFVELLSQELPDVRVIEHHSDTVAAIGAATARPESEVLRFTSAADPAKLEEVRRAARTMTQTQVLALGGRTDETRIISDQIAPLSFLNTDTSLLRVHCVGTTAYRS